MAGPYSNDQGNPAAAIPVYIAGTPAAPVVPVPPTPAPATIAASGTWNSGVMPSAGYKSLAAACTLSQAGTLTIQRYIDAAGSIAIGVAAVQPLSAGVPAWAVLNDGCPSASFSVVVTNTSGTTGNLTGATLLASAV